MVTWVWAILGWIVANYFGFSFGEEGQELLRLAARGEYQTALDTFHSFSYRPTGAEQEAFVTTLLAIRATDVAAGVASVLFRENPDSVDTVYLHALAEIYAGREDAAIRVATDATKRLGQHPCLYTAVGLAMMSVESLQKAATTFQVALQQQAKPIVYAYLAEVLRLMGRTKDALGVFQRCFSEGCTEAEAYYLAGNAFYDDGQIDLALQHYEKAISHKPYYLDAHDVLNKVLWEHRKRDQFLESFNTASVAMPDFLELRLRQAHYRIVAGELKQAESGLEDCLATFGPEARTLSELATVKEQLDPSFDVLSLYKQAWDLNPHNTSAIKHYSQALIGKANYSHALEVLKARKPEDRFDQECLALEAVCNNHLNRTDAERLNDYEGLVQVFDLPAPSGHASLQAFNQLLLESLRPLHRSGVTPIEPTLVRGTQTQGNLFQTDSAAIKSLEESLRTLVSTYIGHVKKVSPGELRDRITERFDFTGAKSVHLSNGGFQKDRVQADGWFSAIYYVEVPEELDAVAKEGWLKFGDIAFDPGNQGPQHSIEPKPGRLAVFPSYMYHGTVPIAAGKSLTTIAVEVVPC